MWISPDPARQFNNPYNGMGGDPVNNTDPNGEIACGGICVAIVVGAVAGAITGGVKANNRGYDLGDWESYAYVGGGAVLGGAAGAAAFGAGVWATGAAGYSSGSAFVGALAGGAVGGATGATINTAGMYAMDHGAVHDEKGSCPNLVVKWV